MPLTREQLATISRQERGLERNGSISLIDYDRGVVETLGAFIEKDNYWLTIPGLDAPPGLPGVPVAFSFPEDVFKSYKLPMLLVRRDDIAPAMERWHPGMVVYRTPKRGDRPVSASIGNPPANEVKTGPNEVEQQEQAIPYDITYTLSCISHYRGGVGVRQAVQTLFSWVLAVYQPYCMVVVKDSLGSTRTYSAFQEGTSVLDEIAEVSDRVLGFGVTLRVEAELDLNDPYVVKTVSKPLTLNLSVK